jgi:hypothetical protein
VSEKTHQVGFCDIKICAGRKLAATFDQTLEKSTGFADMGKCTDIMTFQYIRRKVIKENIRSLKSKTISSTIIIKILF